MYRKQVRRRRAVLALLIVGSFALLTLTYGQGSNGIQRGVTAVFSPDLLGPRPGAEARPRPDQLGRRNLRRAGQEPQARRRTPGRPQGRRRRQGGAGRKRRTTAQLLKLDKSGAIPSGYTPGDRARDRALADGLVQRRDDRRRLRRRGRGCTTRWSTADGLVGEVTAVTGGASKVKLISDHSSAVVGAGRPGRACRGWSSRRSANRTASCSSFLNSDKNIHKGETVVTAGWRGEGIESRFPPNIPVGEVTKASLIEQEAQEQLDRPPLRRPPQPRHRAGADRGQPASDPHPENRRPPGRSSACSACSCS